MVKKVYLTIVKIGKKLPPLTLIAKRTQKLSPFFKKKKNNRLKNSSIIFGQNNHILDKIKNKRRYGGCANN